MKTIFHSLQNGIILFLNRLKRTYIKLIVRKNLFSIRSNRLFDEALYQAQFPDEARSKVFRALQYLYGKLNRQSLLSASPGEMNTDNLGDVFSTRINPQDHSFLYSHNKDQKEDIYFVNSQYEEYVEKSIDFENPRTFTEKIQIYKLFYRNPLLTQLADKYRAREYISEKVGEDYLIPLFGVYDHTDDIKIETLPDQFVIKVNHGSGWTIKCEDKSTFSWLKEFSLINQRLCFNYYKKGLEWAYKNIQPKIIIENLVIDNKGGEWPEFSIFCFAGTPKLVLAYGAEYENDYSLRWYYDCDWNYLPFHETNYPHTTPPHTTPMMRPNKLDEMLEIARKLSSGIPFVRVDLYALSEKIYCGELTFYPYSGYYKFKPPEWDEIIGSWFDISSFYNPLQLKKSNNNI